MTQYLLSVHHVQGEPMPSMADMQPTFEAVGAFNAELVEAGVWLFAGGLTSPDSATTVDGRGERPILTDGPFAESKEWLGGFWIIDVPDLDTALAYAAAGSRACNDKVEVRPFHDEPDAEE